MLQIKRIYTPVSKEDGYRVLVDRLWPRRLSKEKAHIDLWLKDIAPSNELRKWYGHETKKWKDFEKKYKKELSSKKELIQQLKNLEKQHKIVTLLFGAKDIKHSNAQVLLMVLK